jgi:sugar lactone lactonase YvrE
LSPADGIQVDTFGNVYSCTGDGLYVWDPNGVLLMRAFIPDGGCVSLYFTGKGQIIITAQARLYLLQLAPYVNGPALDTYPRIDKRITLAFPPS